MEGLIYGGKFAFQNRPGLYWERNLRLKIDWASLWLEANFISNLQKVFTETSLENVDVVVNFLFQLIFIFPLFWGMVMYANEFKTKEKQKLTEIKN